MKKSTDVGMNRTGKDTSPKLSTEMVEGTEELMPKRATFATDGEATRTRLQYAEEADPIGTVPPPGTVKGAAKTAMQALKGHKATVFIDKLGERAGYERTGVRLYDAVLLKFASTGTWDGGPTEERLREFREAELRHFELLKGCIEKLGADPTALTPHANLMAVASEGVLKVAVDPRTTLPEVLEALLTAELVDNAAWEILVSLADTVGMDDMAAQFRDAHQEEMRHLSDVRRWLSSFVEGEATRSVELEQPRA